MTLHNGDALEVLRDMPACSIDAIVTDPPYATTGAESSRVDTSSKASVPRETQFFEAWIREHLNEWRRVLKPTGAAWFTIDWLGGAVVEMACAKLGLPRPAVGVWHRGGLGMGTVLRKTYECFVVVRMEDFVPLKNDEADLWSVKWTPGNRTFGHSAEKPVPLLRRAIELITDKPGQVVLDPFMGSGSTAIAAYELGRGFIGIERDEDFYRIANERLQAAQDQPRLLAEIA